LSAAEIVASLNHYSRQDELKINECNIHEIIDNCLVILQSQLKNKIEVTKLYDTQLAIVIGNEGKLHQAFLNVITNAEQSIVDHGIINIVTEIKSNFINIAISDNGCGIDSENIQKVIDPFFTTKAPGKGTGLGLSITYNIIQEHNGIIEFNSQPNLGTIVTIRLPLQKDKLSQNGE
jgi:signal transduction histidine kinase